MKDWLIKKFVKVIDREAALNYTLGKFGHENKDLIVIVADPKTDMLFLSYGDKMFLKKIKTADGKNQKVVKGVLNGSIFHKKIDFFLTGIMEGLQLRLKQGNLFYHFIDAALFKISGAAHINPVDSEEALENVIIRNEDIKKGSILKEPQGNG